MPLNVQCKRCANLKNGWCENVIDSPDPNLNRDCQHFRTKTHYDEVHAMSLEELAHFLEMKAGRFVSFYPTPAKNWLDWLRQEALP